MPVASRNTPYLDELSNALDILEDLWQTLQDSDLDEDVKDDACSRIESAIDELQSAARLM